MCIVFVFVWGSSYKDNDQAHLSNMAILYALFLVMRWVYE